MNKFIASRNSNIFYTSNDIGVKPILSQLNQNQNYFKDADIEDTIIGKAAASLLVYGKVHSVYAHVISQAGKEYLEQFNIPFHYDTLVKEIRNRTDTDMCPLEKSVLYIEDPIKAKQALEKTIQEIMKGNAK